MAATTHDPASKVLGRRALIALDRIGDLMMPRDGEFPAFSELGCIAHVDDVALHAPAEDIHSLGMLLTMLSFMPGFVLRGFVGLLARADAAPEPVASLLRLIEMGIRSLVVTLYFSGKTGRGYAGKTPLDLTGFSINAIRP